jgi:DNA-binding MarR family transcriptional regulator
VEQTVARSLPADGVDVGPMRDSLGFLLRMAQLQTYGHYFAELKDFELKPGEFTVLTVILRNPGIRQGVLAQSLMIKRAHMTKLIRSLEDRGFVGRAIPDDDRRSVTLTLTEDGRRSVERHWRSFLRYERTPKSGLTLEEERQLVSLLQAFVGLRAEVPA